ncbi:alsin homolog [Ochlerotatus camptorhynchus]|uniref:alsin homolog n=1 Tax=Ochlerotatus camptorhynchus TaxID=644619 RepID=UPI0031D3BC82
MSAGISVYSELSDASRLSVLVSGDLEHPLTYGIKLKGCGEYYLLLTVDGKLFLGEHRLRDKAIEFRFLRDDVADFDTEGNWVYLVSKLEGKVYQGKNGSFELWSQLFEDSEIRFEKICCNNNGLLVTSSSGDELYAQGDFGSLLNYEELAPVKEITSENVVQITAGIDFVILSSRKTAKVIVDVKKDPFYDRYCLQEDGRYTDWKNIYRDLNVSFERTPVDSDIINNVNVDSVTVYGQMIHETGVASFGKVNKGQLGTGDHIRRDKIVHLKLFNVSKIATCCDYSSALTLDGNLFLWGDTHKNQASLDSSLSLSSASTPTLFNRFLHILDVACGNYQTYIVTNDLRIHDVRMDEESLNYECADRKQQLEIPNWIAPDELPLILATDSLIIVNHLPLNKELIRVYTKEQTTTQKLLKHFKEYDITRILRNPSNILAPHFFYRSCTRLFYLLLLNLKSLYKCALDNDLTKIVSLLMHEEVHFLYRQIVKCYCDSDCLGLMHESEQKLLQIYLDNVKNFIELIEVLVNANKSLSEEVENRLLNIKSEWLRFLNEEVSEEMGKFTKTTKEFWLNEENFRWYALRECHRRVILDSTDVPLKLLEVNIFSSSPRIVLFSDVLCYLSGMQLVEYPLELIWISAEIKETLKNKHRDKLRFMINIIAPEESLRCYTMNSADKGVWLNTLKAHVMRNLKKEPSAKQPMYRYSSYRFTEKHAKYGGMEYNGIWKVGQIDGIGELKGKERSYKGEFYHGDITGYGCMNRTLYGIGTVYEGDFYDGKYNGFGKLKSSNTSASQYFKYHGYFKDDRYSGYGTLITSAYQYNGNFVNDLKEGFGVIEDSLNGVKYIGMFANDKKYGNGILITTNGTYYAGLFANDVLSNSAGGLAIFPSGIYYKGELTIDGPNGKGVFYYPEREIESESFELDDTNTKMSGHTMTGTFAGTWDNVRISNGSMAMNQRFNKVPMLDLKINAERKWASIFTCFHQSVFDTSDISKMRSMDVKRIWNKIAIYITRAKRKEQIKTNNFETKLVEFDDQSAAQICQNGFRLTNLSATSLRSSISDSKLSLNANGTANGTADSLAALDNISMRSFSSIVSREYDDDFMLNPSGGQSRTSPFRDLEIIPDFCISSVDKQGLELLRDYLSEAFRNQYHPLHQLFEKLSNCFYSTYSCWKFTPNSILCEPAMNEWISVVSRIYTLVITVMFPALPKDSTIVDGELLSYQTLLYPILMTQGIYSALFVLYASKCSKNDEIYRQRILICEKKTDENLIQLLDIDRVLIPIIQSSRYQEAIESLNRFKEKCCPSEMMKHINEAFELVNAASKEYDTTFHIAADSLLELVILLIIKANIPQLGAEISLLEDLMQNDASAGDYHSSTQNDYCLTTLKASYQHIISDNFFVNKIFDGESS